MWGWYFSTIQNERRSQRVKSENETISFQKYNTVSEVIAFFHEIDKSSSAFRLKNI